MDNRFNTAILAYDGLALFEFGIAAEIFQQRRLGPRVPWYRTRICAADSGPLRATGGLSIVAPHGLRSLDWAGTIIIPGWRDIHETPPASLLASVRRAHQRGARIVSICSGVFVMAAAGILKGKTATTHWAYSTALQEAYPEIRVMSDVLYVADGNIYSSAGSAAGIDLCLHLVRQDFGAAIANDLARRLVIPAHRDGGQKQFIPRPLPRYQGSLAPLLDWIRGNLGASHSLAALARRIHVSERTLIRRFKDATGLTPHAWILRERIQQARDLLEEGHSHIDTIAQSCGFAAPESFRYHFRRLTGCTPSTYRHQFFPNHRVS